ncbi:MAG: hypothetical protein IPK26_27600 [Planctomycetes bacterium]|nr:hypothetical protein [Planctomycetota bacterium]
MKNPAALGLLGCAYALLAATADSVFWLMLGIPVWLGIGILVRRHRSDSLSAVRSFVTIGSAFAATMLTMLVAVFPLASRPWMHGHPAPGEHPVDRIAGLPWPGVEGGSRALAHGFVPWTMGVDAMACNFTCFLLAMAWFWRGESAAHLRGRVMPVTLFAALGAFAGTIRLALLFQ